MGIPSPAVPNKEEAPDREDAPIQEEAATAQVVVAGALIADGALLVAQRERPPELAGLWELPGGKVSAGESDADALVRELREELGVAVTVGPRIGTDVALGGGMTLRAYLVTRTSGTVAPHDHRALRWIRAADLTDLDWVPADRGWVPDLAAALDRSGQDTGPRVTAIRSVADMAWGQISYLEWAPASTAPVGTVLLLHGGGVDNASLSWGEVGPRLAEAGYRVIAPDHPGYGQSPAAPWPATQQHLVEYVGEFVDALELGRHVAAGLSLGGGLAIGHTLARPDTVTGAILLGSYGLMPRLSDGLTSLPRQALTWAMLRTGLLTAMTRRVAAHRAALDWSMASLVRDRARRTPELMDEVRAAAEAGRGLAAFEQWQRDQIRWDRLVTDYRAALAHITVPVLIVHGDRDTGVPVQRARSAAAVIPDATLEVVAGAGHWVQRDQPDAVIAAMLRFLRRLSAAT